MECFCEASRPLLQENGSMPGFGSNGDTPCLPPPKRGLSGKSSVAVSRFSRLKNGTPASRLLYRTSSSSGHCIGGNCAMTKAMSGKGAPVFLMMSVSRAYSSHKASRQRMQALASAWNCGFSLVTYEQALAMSS